MQTNYLGFYYEFILIRGPQNGGAPDFSPVKPPPLNPLLYICVCTAVLGDFIIYLIMLISYNNLMLPNKSCKPYIKRRRKGVAR